MAKFETFWAKGDYRDRQLAANSEKCCCYLEQHLNALGKDDPETQGDNPALIIVGSNASQTSKNWAAWLAEAFAAEFGIKNGGVIVGPKRGDFNLRYTSMPAVLLEPLFVSDPTQAAILKSNDGQERLARVVSESIRRFFPKGGKVGLSVGHKYKTSKPHDRGAPVYGGGWEADIAEEVLARVDRMLRYPDMVEDDSARYITIAAGCTTTKMRVAPESAVRWNPKTETLTIES